MSPQREEVISKLREHEGELRSLGVKSLALFGSLARGEERLTSDVDIAAIYDETVVRDLLDMARIAAAIESYLETENFDLVSEINLKPHVRKSFDVEHIRIF